MSFFKTSDGKAVQSTGSAEMGGGSLPPIPSGTQVRAMITEAKWDNGGDWVEPHIKLRWDVVDGEYKKRVIFHKVRVKNDDASKRDKALNMLAAIDANAGGKLMKADKEPSDMDLMSNLCNKPMVIRLEEWHITKDRDGNELPEAEHKHGNWVQAVSSGKPGASKPKPEAEKPAAEKPAAEEPDAGDGGNAIGF